MSEELYGGSCTLELLKSAWPDSSRKSQKLHQQ